MKLFFKNFKKFNLVKNQLHVVFKAQVLEKNL